MLNFYFIRHAESVMNCAPHIIGGRSNETPLSERGKLEAASLGKRLVAENILFDKIYSSTAVRCRETARLVGKHMGFSLVDIVFSGELLELSQGEWQGKPRVEIYTPETVASINTDNWNFTPPNGESQRAVEERMLGFVQREVLPFYTKDRMLSLGIFTHGMAIKCLLRGIMKFTPSITYKILLDNTSITRLQYDERGWHLLSVNDTAHLFNTQAR